MEIVFTNILGTEISVLKEPAPAKNSIPDWYKNLESYISGKKEPNRVDVKLSNSTLKKCMPVFDMITCGYMLYTPADLYVEVKEGGHFFSWAGLNMIEFHSPEQFKGNPLSIDGFKSPKFMNPWVVKTPKGYSSLFLQPSHRDLPFTIMPGMVDTDMYHHSVNLPFKMNDPKFEGLIPAGTPMVQVIPIKRESWAMKLGGEKEIREKGTVEQKFDTVFWDRYKRFWWQKKEYK